VIEIKHELHAARLSHPHANRRLLDAIRLIESSVPNERTLDADTFNLGWSRVSNACRGVAVGG
jgi:hypothetical protein